MALYLERFGQAETPSAPPAPVVSRGYTEVPSFDVQRYVQQQLRTFAFGVVVGAALGGTLAALIRMPKRPQ